MISEAMIKARAGRLGVDPAVVDRDHALGVVLSAVAPTLADGSWVFKGGTCLRKCYFGDYRFSEDLDFTVLSSLTASAALQAVRDSAERAGALGVQLLLDQARVQTVDDDYGRASVEIKVPYRGALRMGSAQNVQFHLSSDERMAFGACKKELLHSYDDTGLSGVLIPCYSLEEVLAEKLRAVGGQRRHAIARDVYDVAQLVRRGADVSASLEALPGKAERKGVDLGGAAAWFRGREDEYRASWMRTLAYLVIDALSFEDAFAETAAVLDQIGV